MPALIPTAYYGTITWLGRVADRDAALQSAARRRMISKGPKHGSVPCLVADRARLVEIADERRITITDAVGLCVAAYDKLHRNRC